jgi:hypothetical protein
MVDHLRIVIASLEQLPADQQEELAAHLEAWLKDQNWDEWLKSEEGNQFLDELASAYEQEKQQGTILEEGW